MPLCLLVSGPCSVCNCLCTTHVSHAVHNAATQLVRELVRTTCLTRLFLLQYTMYPQSLYENIVRGSALGVPMYVTEIGCADKSKDDHVRIANVDSCMNQARTFCCC